MVGSVVTGLIMEPFRVFWSGDTRPNLKHGKQVMYGVVVGEGKWGREVCALRIARN